MMKRLFFLLFLGWFIGAYALAQTTNGLLTGVVTDPSGAVVPEARIEVVNQGTGASRVTVSDTTGTYILPQLPLGTYRVIATKDGFAKVTHEDVQIEVNQSVTLGISLGLGSASQTIEVSTAPPALNTTSSTLGDVIGHAETVELPLNGREFTQLTLLSPGAAPQETGQQSAFTINLGAGGISPSVNGQRGEQNNFTMDGVLNNEIFLNIWAVAPPPDAIQEFNVQSHITDAQFAISSGANINVASRSGTSKFHGDVWEFFRNDVLDAQTFPATQRLPYKQNQYGLFLGGPVAVPHVMDNKKTFFSFYWEGYRSILTQAVESSTLTTNMMNGDFSAILGTTSLGTDSLGRAIYANQIYDPLTSRADPNHPGQTIRDPFTGNKIPTNRLNLASQAVIAKYYPAPNLNIANGTLPNLQFAGGTRIDSDLFGFRLDENLTDKDSLFVRLSRSSQHRLTPETLPTYEAILRHYAQEAAFGYTRVLNTNTILNFRYGYTYGNVDIEDQAAGLAFDNSINFTQAAPPKNGISLGPNITITDGYSGVGQNDIPLGPQEGMDYHIDLTKTIGKHTIGAGAMYYHVRFYSDGFDVDNDFTRNATSIDGSAATTGFGPASFVLGVMHNYSPRVGDTAASQTVNWYGTYLQDQWQITPKLVLTAGLRWDYVAPPNYHKIVSGLDVLTGTFVVTGPVLPYFPKATGTPGYFQPQYNGYEPRFGLTYQIRPGTVLHSALAVLDDHNNTLVQQNQAIRQSYPNGYGVTLTDLDIAKPTYFLNTLPSQQSLVTNPTPLSGYSANPNNKIPYSVEYNGGIQQQLRFNMTANLDYVGSISRNQEMSPLANTALTPGPGAIAARQPFPQYGGPINFEWNGGPGNYNSLQAQLKKNLSAGLFFMASYTYSKSLDWVSDPYGVLPANFYNLKAEYGPSDFNHTHMFIFSTVYQLPVGKGKAFLAHSNRMTDTLVGGWSAGSIIGLYSGLPFDILVNGDVANVGGGGQRANRLAATPYRHQGTQYLNTAAFAQPASYTFGNEGRNDLVGPAYKNVDVNLAKAFPLFANVNLQFKAELFNIFNHTNYGIPDHVVGDASFGQIQAAAGTGRVAQFALKLQF
jgi:hypothetical protein